MYDVNGVHPEKADVRWILKMWQFLSFEAFKPELLAVKVKVKIEISTTLHCNWHEMNQFLKDVFQMALLQLNIAAIYHLIEQQINGKRVFI